MQSKTSSSSDYSLFVHYQPVFNLITYRLQNATQKDKDKDKYSKEDMDGKYSTNTPVFDKLEVLAKGKFQNNSKMNQILKQT